MKKILILCALLLLIVSGCSADNDSDVSADDLHKAQAIAVTTPDGSVLQTITDQAAINNFVDALDLDHWELAKPPSDANIIGSFGLSQEKTIHFGEKPNDTLYDVATLTLYDTGHLRCSLSGFNITFALSDDAYNTLAAYFR